MIRLSVLDIFKLFGALLKHGYIIQLEDGTVIYDIIDNATATEFIIDGTKYKAGTKLYITIYKPLSKKAINSLLVNLIN